MHHSGMESGCRVLSNYNRSAVALVDQHKICLWNTRTQKHLVTYTWPSGDQAGIMHGILSPDGWKVVLAMKNGTVRVVHLDCMFYCQQQQEDTYTFKHVIDEAKKRGGVKNAMTSMYFAGRYKRHLVFEFEDCSIISVCLAHSYVASHNL